MQPSYYPSYFISFLLYIRYNSTPLQLSNYSTLTYNSSMVEITSGFLRPVKPNRYI